MTERQYTNARVSKDGRWHVVTETPSVIATPDGAISIAWGGSDQKYRERAEVVAAEIVEAWNRRADLSPALAAAAMREMAIEAVDDLLSGNPKREAMEAIRAIPLPSDADLDRAALARLKVAALVDAALDMRDTPYGQFESRLQRLAVALAALELEASHE